MARTTSRLAALATTLLLAASGGEALAQTSVDVLAGAGSFDTDDWHFQGPDGASFTRAACSGFTGSCARIEGDDLGARPYDAQLVYWNGAIPRPRFVTLQGGKQYRIRLRASASAAGKTIQVALEDAIYRVVGASSFTLGRSPAVHTGDAIVIPADAGRTASIRVNVGGAANDGVTFSIDDLALLEEDAGPPPDPGEQTNLLAAGDFESSPDSSIWNRWANDGSNAQFAIADCSATGFTGNCFRVTGSNFGANPWSTQLVKWSGSAETSLAIDETKSYTLRFRGRAAAAGGRVQVMLQGPAPGYSTPFQQEFELGTTAAEHSSTIQISTDDASGISSLAFKMNFVSTAGTSQVFEVDDLQLLEPAPAP
jgi:hypothetical protein